jgi:hypothetical protein
MWEDFEVCEKRIFRWMFESWIGVVSAGLIRVKIRAE